MTDMTMDSVNAQLSGMQLPALTKQGWGVIQNQFTPDGLAEGIQASRNNRADWERMMRTVDDANAVGSGASVA